MPITTIKKRSDFLLASEKGKRFVTGTFILQMNKRLPHKEAPHKAGLPPRFGFTVTQKMGNAVARNRIKRRLREAIRLTAVPHALPEQDYVVISRQSALDCSFSVLLRDMEFAFSKIPSMKDGQNTFKKYKKPQKTPLSKPKLSSKT